MTLFNRIKWVLGVLMIFALILATNLIDRNSFSQVRNSVETIYEDRLIAKDIIVSMLHLVQEKELAVVLRDSSYFMKRSPELKQELQKLITQFEATKLMRREQQVFQELKTNIQAIDPLEDSYVQTGYEQAAPLRRQLQIVRTSLRQLSKIQLEEGRRQVGISREALNTVELFTHLEIYGLIIIAILVQILLLYRPKVEQEKKP